MDHNMSIIFDNMSRPSSVISKHDHLCHFLSYFPSTYFLWSVFYLYVIFSFYLRSVSPSSSITEASISPGCETTTHYQKDEGTDFTKWRNFVTPVYNIYTQQNQILSQNESAFHHPSFITGKTASYFDIIYYFSQLLTLVLQLLLFGCYFSLLLPYLLLEDRKILLLK